MEKKERPSGPEAVLRVESLSYSYQKGTPFEQRALREISFEIKEGEVVLLVGHTGSGKSTLLQHLNGLLFPASGRVLVDGDQPGFPPTNLKKVRQKIGIVFQFPETQLFEENVFLDVAFGPKNLALSEEEVRERVRNAMELMGLPYEKYHARSCFGLSGGEMRRVAIAGVLAMKPKVLALDEPLAGLDFDGKRQLLRLLQVLNGEEGVTLLIVTHQLQDFLPLATRVLMLSRGKLLRDISVHEFLSLEDSLLEEGGVELPEIPVLLRKLRESLSIKDLACTPPEAAAVIAEAMRG